MTIAAKSTLRIQQGATFRKRFTWATYPYLVEVRNGVVYVKDTGRRAPETDREIVDLTGCTARAQIREKIADATPVLTLTTENGGIALGDVAGTIDLFIADDETSPIDWLSGVWDLEVIHPGGDVSRPVGGAVAVSPEVTRA